VQPHSPKALGKSVLFAVTPEVLRQFLSNKRVLELACGSGFLARRLIEYGVASYLGIDFAETAIAKAREPSRLLPVRIWTSNR
jgi:2-polyprenyl-3-methyl-5-hydroxy-6-metoxy-1,4-benzoquinol methylase